MAESEEPASTRLAFDCFSALLLLMTALLGAYLPRYLSARGGQQSGTATSLAFHLGNMLSGGVMLSAGFCHLLADSLRQLAFIGRFPITPFLAAVGYLITLLADQLVQVLTAEPAAVAGPASSNQRGYTRIDKQQGSVDAIEMIAQGNSCGAVPADSTSSILDAQDSVVSRISTWDSGGGLLEAPGPSQQGHRARVFIPQTEHVTDFSSPTGALGLRGLGRQSERVPDAAAAAAASGGLNSSGGGGAAAVSGDMAVCMTATGSPRAITAGSILTRSAGMSRGGVINSGNRTHLERSIGGLAAAAAAHGYGAGGSPVMSGGAQQLLIDDVLMSHPSTPAALQQQQLQQHVAQVDLLGMEKGQVQQNQGQHEQEQQLLLGQCAFDSSAHLGDHTVLSVPSLVLPTTAAAAAAHTQQQPRTLQQAGSHNPQQQRCCDEGTSRLQDLHQQQQQWHSKGSFVDGAYMEMSTPLAQQSGGHSCCRRVHHCCCCRSGQGICCAAGSSAALRSGSMTEACTVARAAEHLELEMCTPAGAGAPHNHAHFQVFLSHQPLSFATTVLLACALCIHSVLEGVALGAQQTMEATQDIMLAIAAHKGLAAYALGASIVESKASATKFWTVIAMFASATPIGIAIGYASSHIGHGSAGAAMSALASGTFLYVALNEVIPKELEHPDGHRLLKVAALLLGFGLMSLLAVWA